MNISSFLTRSACYYPDNVAIAVGEDVIHTYRSFDDRVSRLASSLLKLANDEIGARFVVAMANCPAYLEIMFAAWRSRCAIVPVNAKLHPDEILSIAEDADASAIFVDKNIDKSMRERISERRVINADSAAYRSLANCGDHDAARRLKSLENDIDYDALAWLFYTSGTTGKPKGAELSHRNLVSMTLGYFSDVEPVAPGASIFHAAPLSHGSGLYAIPFTAKACVHLMARSKGFDPAELLNVIQGYERVSMFLAPTMVRRLTRHVAQNNSVLKPLNTIIYGGGPMYVEDSIAARKTLGSRLVQIYGQAEAPMTITVLSRHDHDGDFDEGHRECLSTVGRPQTGVEVRIGDAGQSIPKPGEIGEILVRGDVVMKGYWNNQEATRETLANGWLHTGDLGCFDSRGRLKLVDRSKDVIISGGTNIYPREVEEVLLSHSAVAEVCVVGEIDDEWGENVVAFIVTADGEHCGSDALDGWCIENMARFKRPKRYLFVEELPKNDNGKVLKKDLRQQLKDEQAPRR